MKPKLVLFDIDGTLVSVDGAGGRSLNRAMLELTGIDDGFRGIDFAGKTDLQIVREGLRRLDLPHDGEMPHSLVRLYLRNLSEELSARKGHVKVGVEDLLKSLEILENLHLGLLTGNYETGARLKFEPFGLNSFFSLGAFGSDYEERDHLLPVAVRRLKESKGISVEYNHCVVVGDTPRDVDCARVHGAASIAVATGPYSPDRLKKTEADLVVSDLSDTARIVDWIHTVGDSL